jgi:hypothetical protein
MCSGDKVRVLFIFCADRQGFRGVICSIYKKTRAIDGYFVVYSKDPHICMYGN